MLKPASQRKSARESEGTPVRQCRVAARLTTYDYVLTMGRVATSARTAAENRTTSVLERRAMSIRPSTLTGLRAEIRQRAGVMPSTA